MFLESSYGAHSRKNNHFESELNLEKIFGDNKSPYQKSQKTMDFPIIFVLDEKKELSFQSVLNEIIFYFNLLLNNFKHQIQNGSFLKKNINKPFISQQGAGNSNTTDNFPIFLVDANRPLDSQQIRERGFPNLKPSDKI